MSRATAIGESAAALRRATTGRRGVGSETVIIATAAFAALVIVGVTTINGFASVFSVRAMLVLAAFLGIASVGQTLTALVGGIDLSIPFVIGGANVGLPYLVGRGLNIGLAIVVILAVAALIGLTNGAVSYWTKVHPLVVTLGMGFAVVGGAQIITSIGTDYAGNVWGGAPGWLIRMTSTGGKTFGLGMPAVVFIWLGITIVVILGMRLTRFGRYVYAIGDNRGSARRALIDERLIWLGVFTISAVGAAFAGMLLVGFTGGGFAAVGDPYLFTTLAAVVIGGTSLLGGSGGYGLTVIGAGVLTVLSTILVGFGLKPPAQESILGAIIVLMVALYAREPHPRTRV